MTLHGTRSYVLRDGEQVWVVDPGPKDAEHLAELLVACGEGVRPMGVLVTHRHLDHTAGAATLARQLGARGGSRCRCGLRTSAPCPGPDRCPRRWRAITGWSDTSSICPATPPTRSACWWTADGCSAATRCWAVPRR
ncbi:MBL fold metallo-hydrolase [Brachybacterium sacelli]|uniref:MBL fold metallo-hydrolase n=1 Tax=Brachybacterium sacelli TaxID=173364 RepID=UPI00360A71B0